MRPNLTQKTAPLPTALSEARCHPPGGAQCHVVAGLTIRRDAGPVRVSMCRAGALVRDVPVGPVDACAHLQRAQHGMEVVVLAIALIELA